MTWVPDREPEEPRRLGESLDHVARSLGAPKAAALSVVFDGWDAAVGQPVASHAKPFSLVRGTLVVHVEEPAWASHLRWLQADLLRRLADVAGEGVVERIEVRVKPPR